MAQDENSKPLRSTKMPRSATSFLINFMGVVAMMIAMGVIRSNNINSFKGVIIIFLCISLTIIFLEYIFLKTYKRESTGINWKKRNKLDLNRVVIKLLGLYLSLGLIAMIYYFLPVYRDGYYAIYWNFLKIIVPVILIGSIPYFIILDVFLKEPEESYYNAGLVLIGKWKEVNTKDLKNHFLGWLIKGFFLPLMLVPLNGNINYSMNQPTFVNCFVNFHSFFDYVRHYFFTIDLAFVSVGYLMSMRILDSHIRTAEPTFYGWGVALLCYPPFNQQLHGLYINYQDGFTWMNWLSGNPAIYAIWGMIILFLFGVYVWATIPFGIRFSNLTHRGILTNGPYRFMRHPAYVSKNLAWWFVSIPFISSFGATEAIARCFGLLLLNLIYFMRAKTEENHLSKDPVYIQYATAINDKGLFKWLFKRVPYFRYKPEKYTNLSKDVNVDL